MSSPESLAGDHASSDIARRGQLWVPAAVTETTGRRLPSEASPSGGGAGDKNKERVQSGSGRVWCQDVPRGRSHGGGMGTEYRQPPCGVPAILARPEKEPGPPGSLEAWSTLRPPEPLGPESLLPDRNIPSPGPKATSTRRCGASGSRVQLSVA